MQAGVQLPKTMREVKRGVDYAQELEEELDQQYDDYRERKGMKKKYVRLGNKSKVIGASVDPNADAPDTDYVPEVDDGSDSDSDDDAAGDADDANPLLAKRDGASAAQRTASLWFAQSQFADLDDDDEEEEGNDENADVAVPSKTRATKRRKVGVKATGATATGADEADDDDGELKALIAQEAKEEAAAAEGASSDDSDSDDDDDDEGEKKPDFEEVAAAARAPAPSTTGNLDAHGLALAAEMILRRKKREVGVHLAFLQFQRE